VRSHLVHRNLTVVLERALVQLVRAEGVEVGSGFVPLDERVKE